MVCTCLHLNSFHESLLVVTSQIGCSGTTIVQSMRSRHEMDRLLRQGDSAGKDGLSSILRFPRSPWHSSLFICLGVRISGFELVAGRQHGQASNDAIHVEAIWSTRARLWQVVRFGKRERDKACAW